MARCLAIMQHHRRAAEERVNLHGWLPDLELQMEQLAIAKGKLEQEVLDLKKVNADKESALAEKEVELAQCREELGRAEYGMKESEAQLTEMQTDMTRKEAS